MASRCWASFFLSCSISGPNLVETGQHKKRPCELQNYPASMWESFFQHWWQQSKILFLLLWVSFQVSASACCFYMCQYHASRMPSQRHMTTSAAIPNPLTTPRPATPWYTSNLCMYLELPVLPTISHPRFWVSLGCTVWETNAPWMEWSVHQLIGILKDPLLNERFFWVYHWPDSDELINISWLLWIIINEVNAPENLLKSFQGLFTLQAKRQEAEKHRRQPDSHDKYSITLFL